MPRVTVLMPSYNHEKYIAQAIQSVLNQTYQDFEIVITDDGSTDGTVNEVRKFKDPRIRLFTFKENQGAAVANLNNIAEAKGEYFAMLSSDDMFVHEKLEKQVKYLDEYPDVWAVFSHARVIDEDGNDISEQHEIYNRTNKTRFEWLNHFFFKGNALYHPSVLARRECYTELGPPDPRLAQTGDFNRWIRVCLKHDIYIIPEKYLIFRVRAGQANASGNRPEVVVRTQFEVSQILKNYLEIETEEEFYNIFPEALRYKKKFDNDLIPFIVAILALEVNSPSHHNFAINILFNLLNNKGIVEKLEKRFNFSYINFIELTGKVDLFNMKLRDMLIEFDQKLIDRDQKLIECDHMIQSLTNTYSWKLTTPLRWMFSKLIVK